VKNEKNEELKKIYDDPFSYFYKFDDSNNQDLLPWENKANLSDYLANLLEVGTEGEILSNFE